MGDTGKVAANLRAFKIAKNSHDSAWPEPHPEAFGVALSGHDMGRLGFEDGEELWPGFTIHTDDGSSGNFRILCGGLHGEQPDMAEVEELTPAVGTQITSGYRTPWEDEVARFLAGRRPFGSSPHDHPIRLEELRALDAEGVEWRLDGATLYRHVWGADW